MQRMLVFLAAPLFLAGLAGAQLNPVWTKYHNSANAEDYGYATALDAAGNAYLTGSATNASGEGMIFLAKYAPNGVKLWTRTYSGGGGGPDSGWVVQVTRRATRSSPATRSASAPATTWSRTAPGIASSRSLARRNIAGSAPYLRPIQVR